MAWPCFWCEDTGEVELGLRRFTWSDTERHGPRPPREGLGRRRHVALKLLGEELRDQTPEALAVTALAALELGQDGGVKVDGRAHDA